MVSDSTQLVLDNLSREIDMGKYAQSVSVPMHEKKDVSVKEPRASVSKMEVKEEKPEIREESPKSEEPKTPSARMDGKAFAKHMMGKRSEEIGQRLSKKIEEKRKEKK